MYYLCSENKGADQLRGHREADLRLCFAHAKHLFSDDTSHMFKDQMANTVDPDQTIQYQLSHLDLVFANSAIGASGVKFGHEKVSNHK